MKPLAGEPSGPSELIRTLDSLSMQVAIPNRYRFVIGATLFLLQIAVGLNFFAPAPLFPRIIEAYQIDKATVSLMISGVTIVLAIFSIPAGIVAGRIGLRLAIVLGGFLVSAGLFIPVAPNFTTLLLLRMVYGLGAAIVVPISSAIAMQWFPPKELPVINGLLLMGQSFGVSLSMFFGLGIAQALGGWQAPLFLYGCVAITSTLVWIMLGRTRSTARTITVISLKDAIKVLPQKNTLLLGLAVVGPFAQYVALTSWLPTYYQQVRGMSPALTSLVTGLLPFVGIGATLAGGLLPARIGLRKPFLLVPGALIGTAGVLTFVSGNLGITLVGIILLGILSWVFTPTAFTIPMELPGNSPEKVGVVLGAINSMGNFATFLSPIMVGLVADATGSYVPGFAFWAFATLSLLTSALLLPETGPKAKRSIPRQTMAERA